VVSVSRETLADIAADTGAGADNETDWFHRYLLPVLKLGCCRARARSGPFMGQIPISANTDLHYVEAFPEIHLKPIAPYIPELFNFIASGQYSKNSLRLFADMDLTE
jgi:hypothetical protein